MTIVDELRAGLQAAGCPAHRAGMEHYFTTSMTFLGVTTERLRQLVRTAVPRCRELDGETVLTTALELVEGGVFEERQAAYELISRHPAAMARLDRGWLEALGRGNDNWASVDTLACLLVGPRWLAGGLPDSVIEAWADSTDLWWRRTALVATTTLNKKSHGGRGDSQRTLAVARRFVAERHPMMVKALSWALRQLAPWEPEGVAGFLDEHRAALPSQVKREVLNKLTTGLKRTGKPKGRTARS